LIKAGCDITINTDTIRIKVNKRLRAIGCVHTAPYPGFPTDLQSQLSVLLSKCRGVSTITENLFENRFRHLDEITKLGAKVCGKGKSAVITRVKELTASANEDRPINLFASDLRGGVALTIVAITAPGSSIVHNAEYIYRGHADIEKDLVSLGANIIKE
ncbi:MAG: UDP-N-acetylglucosamine 1-carboxyvinyltransferase, partial [Christensenellaceae bacterium]|nr:UDP-N-acetylglucosamine 1-carboxyvinyltransferase [Christensenellaceae bacterium]